MTWVATSVSIDVGQINEHKAVLRGRKSHRQV